MGDLVDLEAPGKTPALARGAKAPMMVRTPLGALGVQRPMFRLLLLVFLYPYGVVLAT